MGRPSIVDDVMQALKELYPREVHITELADRTQQDKVKVSNALNNRLEVGVFKDIERTRRGVWRYVPLVSSADDQPKIPSLLEVLGTTKAGLMVRDPDTMKVYEAKEL